MKSWPPVLGTFLALFCAGEVLAAEGANSQSPDKPFQASFLGEGGVSPQPSGSASDFLEHNPRQQTGQGTFGPIGREGGPPRQDSPKPVASPEKNPPQGNVEMRSSPPWAQTAPAREIKPSHPNFSAAPGVNAVPKDAEDGALRGTAPGVNAVPKDARDGLPNTAAQTPGRDGDRRRYALWEGLVAPLELPAEKVRDMAPDQASQAVRRDYDTHILGQAGAAVAAGLAGPREPVQEGKDGAEVFVALDLDLRKGSDAPLPLKDAVADLGRAAGFRQDPRFEALSDASRPTVSLWGWMPAGRLAEAMKVPSVARLEVRQNPSGSASPGTASDMLVGLRVPAKDPGLGEAFARVSRELSEQAGFRWKRIIGTQALPGARDQALIVIGEVPLKNLSRLLAHSDVLKIMPAPGVNTFPEDARDGALRGTAPTSPEAPARGPLKRFFSYALSRSPLLLLSTVVLTLGLVVLRPSTGGLLARLLGVFVPYH